jgi:hypothetical protein
MPTVPVTEAELISTVASLNFNYSSGYDGLSNKIIKLCSQRMSIPLTYVFNSSLSEGIFSYCLKYAVVKPVFKKGDKTFLTNYRSISV